MKAWQKPEFWIILGFILFAVMACIYNFILGWCMTSGTCR